MNQVEAALTKQMQETEPALDTTGADRKIIQIAYQDLINYMKFHWQHAQTDMDNMTPTEKMNQTTNENPKEFENFLAVWTGLWLKKWQKRVKIILSSDQNQNNTQNQNTTQTEAETNWQRLNTKQEMIEIITLALVRNSEICGTQLLAENLLRKEVAKKTNIDVSKPETQLNLLNAALSRAHEAALTSGPTLFMKVNSIYFEAQKH